MINKVILEGRLTKNPEIRTTNNGKKFISVSIALNRGKDEQGNDLGTDYPTVIAWEKSAEFIGKWFNQGDGICIVGRIQTRNWDDNGVTRYATEVVVEKASFPEGKKSAEKPVQSKPAEAPQFSISREDLPF